MDITYNLETLTGKHGGLLEVVESIISDGRLILILTDEDVLQRRDAPLKGVFYRLILPLAPATMNVAFSMGARPSPTMSRAPSNTVTSVAAGTCPRTAAEHAETTKRPRSPATGSTWRTCIFTRCIEASTV